MPRSAARTPSTPLEADRDAGVVRTEKAIPTLCRTTPQVEETPLMDATLCSGRCGHCNVHPCQLHAPI